MKKYSSFSETKIGNLLKKLNKYVGKGLSLAELACTAVMLAQIDRDSVCHLMTVIEVGGGKWSDEYKGLSRLLDRIDNLDEYVMEKYFCDELIDKFFDLTEDLVGGQALKTTKIIAGFLSVIYSMQGGKTANDFLKTYSAMNIASYTKFGFQKTTNFVDAELAFGFYKAAVKNFLNYCIKLADVKSFSFYTNTDKFKQLKANAELHSNLIGNFCTYEKMMEEAKALTKGQALEEYLPDYTTEKYGLSAKYDVKTGKFEVMKTTSSSAGTNATDNKKMNEDDYIFIPSSVDDNKVICIADNGFECITDKYGIIFPDTIEKIGNYSFANSTSIELINLNDSLTEIGNHAFFNCSSLECISIPENVVCIGDNAFEGCSSLNYIEINTDSLGNNAFLNCSSLTEIRFNNRNTIIGNNVFNGCSENLIITGYKNSTAERYAEENSIIFEAIPEYVTSLTIVTSAQKTEFNLGDDIDTIGLKIKAIFEDGTSEIISDGWITMCDISSAGSKTVTIF